MPLSQRITRGRVGLCLGPVLAAACLLLPPLEPSQPAANAMAAIALLMAVLWITEAIPLAATALLPVVLFPLFGIMSGREVAPIYTNDIIFLFLGGFLVALAMQRTELHRRIALMILLRVGTKPPRLLLGFMLATGFLSMWISNSATTMILVPIAIAIASRLDSAGTPEGGRSLSLALLLGVAYAASIGGFATLVGTPPNLAFARQFEISFPDAPAIDFTSWLSFAFPIALALGALTWVYLAWRLLPRGGAATADRSILVEELRKLGPASLAERSVLLAFIVLVFAWLGRRDLELGALTVPGWSRLIPGAQGWDDGTVAMLVALTLFALPFRTRAGQRILDTSSVRDLPFDMILLFGGGFALATGIERSGLSGWIGTLLLGLDGLSPLLLVIIVVFVLIFLTELTSNLATTQMVLPILAAMARSLEIDPLLLMIPATLACSCAFMLPVATPPNAIVFATGRVRITDMVKAGFALNLLAIAVIVLGTLLIGNATLGISFDQAPSWAMPR